jgi:predicted CopG family antitoxin
MSYQLMATITLTVTTEVHDKLKKLKVGQESFSEMLMRELPDRANTCGEVLEKLAGTKPPGWADIMAEVWRMQKGVKSRKRVPNPVLQERQRRRR